MSPGSGASVRREQRLEAAQVFSADRRGEALRLAHAVDEDEVTDRDDGDLPRFSAERAGKKLTEVAKMKTRPKSGSEPPVGKRRP